MIHDQRVAIAQEIAGQILNRYGRDIVGIAVYGSVAKGEDAEHSDVELWIATTDQVASRDVLCIYQGVSVELYYGVAQEFLADAQHVDPYWPLRADMRRSLLVLYERDNFFDKLRQAAAALPEEEFHEALRVQMLRLRELVGKLRNAQAQQDRYGVLALARDMTFGVALLIGLANRRYYPSQRGLYQQSKQMPLQPEHYAELLDAAGGFTSTNLMHVYEAALALWDDVQRFIESQGVVWSRDRLLI